MFKSRKFRFFPQQIACWHVVSSRSRSLFYYQLHHFFVDGFCCLIGPDQELTMNHNLQEDHPISEDRQDLLPVWWGSVLGTSEKPQIPDRNVLLFKFLVMISFIFLIPLLLKIALLTTRKASPVSYGSGGEWGSVWTSIKETGQSNITGFVRNLCVGKHHGKTKPTELVDGLRPLHRTLSFLNHLVRPKQLIFV